MTDDVLRWCRCVMLLAGIWAMTTPAWAVDIGRIKVARGQVAVERAGAALPAAVGMRLQASDTIRTGDDGQAIVAMRERFGIDAAIHEDAVTFAVSAGEQFVPRLFAELGVPISSVNVSRPSLDDVFLTYTGRTIRDAEASSSERLRAGPFAAAARR